jgi:hypothetical protein
VLGSEFLENESRGKSCFGTAAEGSESAAIPPVGLATDLFLSGGCLGDDAAGDPVSGVTRRIRHVIVRVRMNDDGTPVGVKHRGFPRAQRDAIGMKRTTLQSRMKKLGIVRLN